MTAEIQANEDGTATLLVDGDGRRVVVEFCGPTGAAVSLVCVSHHGVMVRTVTPLWSELAAALLWAQDGTPMPGREAT